MLLTLYIEQYACNFPLCEGASTTGESLVSLSALTPTSTLMDLAIAGQSQIITFTMLYDLLRCVCFVILLM